MNKLGKGRFWLNYKTSDSIMNELLDQNTNKTKTQSNGSKPLNTVLLVLSIVVVLFTYLHVWNTKASLSSPWLPKYTAYYMNSALINYATIQFGGFVPALFLRIRKHYVLSSICMLAFLLAATILKNSVEIYKQFY